MRTAGKRRRQRARRHDVLDADIAVAAVEIAHLAGAHMRGANGEPRLALVDQREVDQFQQRLFQRRGGVEAGCVRRRAEHASRGMRRDWARRKPGCRGAASSSRRSCRQCRSTPGRRTAADTPSAPEFLQRSETISVRIAGDQAGIDRADRGADDPVRLDAVLVQRLIDASLVGAERAAALQHQNDLAIFLVLACCAIGKLCHSR